MNSSLVFGLQRSSVFGKWTCSSVQVDYRFDPVRTLLAAAPHGGERRDNFARSLVRHRAGCQGRVAQSTDCDCRVSWCAHKPPRKAATPAPPPVHAAAARHRRGAGGRLHQSLCSNQNFTGGEAGKSMAASNTTPLCRCLTFNHCPMLPAWPAPQRSLESGDLRLEDLEAAAAAAAPPQNSSLLEGQPADSVKYERLLRALNEAAAAPEFQVGAGLNRSRSRECLCFVQAFSQYETCASHAGRPTLCASQGPVVRRAWSWRGTCQLCAQPAARHQGGGGGRHE